MTSAERIVEETALSQERAMLGTINKLAELEMARKQALGAVASAYGIGDLDKHIEALRDQVKQFLALEGLTSLRDGETGVEVVLQERKGTPVYDVPRLIQSTAGQAALLTAAGQVGMVVLNHKQVERAEKTGAEFLEQLAKVRMPGQGSTALTFAERGKWQ